MDFGVLPLKLKNRNIGIATRQRFPLFLSEVMLGTSFVGIKSEIIRLF
jgi:hypothetical protein